MFKRRTDSSTLQNICAKWRIEHIFGRVLRHAKGKRTIENGKTFLLSKSFTFSFFPFILSSKSKKLKESPEPTEFNSSSGG